MSSEVVPRQAGLNGGQREVVKSQAELIRKNISAINEAQRQEEVKRSTLDRVADAITNFSGSMFFVILHVFWFGLWILHNEGFQIIPGLRAFDRFPFGLLTMIVSLEAIFLSTFVLISQNRMAKLSEKRAELDLHVNLLAEQKATKALEMLDQITEQLNSLKHFNFRHDPEVKALKVSPEPQEVLEVMKESVAEEAAEVKREVGEAVEEISGEVEAVKRDVREVTGETEAVRTDVEEVDDKVEEIADDVRDIKEEIKAKSGEREKVLLS